MTLVKDFKLRLIQIVYSHLRKFTIALYTDPSMVIIHFLINSSIPRLVSNNYTDQMPAL